MSLELQSACKDKGRCKYFGVFVVEKVREGVMGEAASEAARDQPAQEAVGHMLS